MNNNLTKEEQLIEDEIETYVPISKERKKYLESLINEEISTTKPITIRLSEIDLLKIKDRATKEGMRYQTLISSILHKFVNNRFNETNEKKKQ
ncbi:MAG: antitoxin [Thermodesulfobacteriota bacterium]